MTVSQKLPRLNRRILLEKTRKGLELPQSQGFAGGRPVRFSPTRQQIFKEAFAQAMYISRGLEEKYKKKLVGNGAFAKAIAGLYSWPELYTGNRGFVSEKQAFSHKKTNKKTGKTINYVGVDTILMRLLNSKVTKTSILSLTTTLLFMDKNFFDPKNLTRQNTGGRAITLYHQELKPILSKIGFYPEEYKSNGKTRYAIDHNLCLLLNLGLERAYTSRIQREILQKIPRKEPTPEQLRELRKDKILSRQDIKEELEKGEGVQELLDLFPIQTKERKQKKMKNRFRA